MNKVTLVIRLLVDIRVILIWNCINKTGSHFWSHADRAYVSALAWDFGHVLCAFSLSRLIWSLMPILLTHNHCNASTMGRQNAIRLRALFFSLWEMSGQVEHDPRRAKPLFEPLQKAYKKPCLSDHRHLKGMIGLVVLMCMCAFVCSCMCREKKKDTVIPRREQGEYVTIARAWR